MGGTLNEMEWPFSPKLHMQKHLVLLFLNKDDFLSAQSRFWEDLGEISSYVALFFFFAEWSL